MGDFVRDHTVVIGGAAMASGTTIAPIMGQCASNSQARYALKLRSAECGPQTSTVAWELCRDPYLKSDSSLVSKFFFKKANPRLTRH
jgi:hypothetical protein